MRTDAERFISHVAKEDGGSGCWLWVSIHSKLGYGWFSVKGRLVQAHRYSYEMFVGKIAPGLTIDHLCRLPICVNPAHLEAVTHRENVLRGVGVAAIHAAKTHCLREHPLSGENLLVRSRLGRTSRACIICNKKSKHEWYLRNKNRRVR